MDENVTCVVCGGNNFYIESGYYFNNKCQTQTQEIQEHVFEEFDEKQEYRNIKKIKKKTNPEQLSQVKLTTWESYNYVIKGLTEDLINLGADIRLRSVAKKLLIKYLFKIEVGSKEKSKLQAVNMKKDAEIVYGKRKKRERSRKRKAPIEAQ